MLLYPSHNSSTKPSTNDDPRYGEDGRFTGYVGMDDFLPKPVELEALGAVLDKWYGVRLAAPNPEVSR